MDRRAGHVSTGSIVIVADRSSLAPFAEAFLRARIGPATLLCLDDDASSFAPAVEEMAAACRARIPSVKGNPIALAGARVIVLAPHGQGLAPILRVTGKLAEALGIFAPDAVVVVAAEPAVLPAVLARKARLPVASVLGAGAAICAQRLRRRFARELGVAEAQVVVPALGGTGESLVVPENGPRVAGIALDSFLPEERIATEILVARSGPPASCAELACWAARATAAIVRGRREVMPAMAHVSIPGVRVGFLGVLARLGGAGIEDVLMPRLTERDRARLSRAAYAMDEQASRLA
ncbi:MAG: hypothetical protein U0166_08775 [Acidobacteriota bacterium]